METYNRMTATEQTVARFLPARYALGKADCVRMAAFHAKAMGHKVSLAKAGSYSTEAGAVAALKRVGFDTLEAALDARFARIAPAEAWVGDIIALPSPFVFPALAILLANNAVLHVFGEGFAVSRPQEFAGAWRVPCLMKARAHG